MADYIISLVLKTNQIACDFELVCLYFFSIASNSICYINRYK